jgi:hypothetical protein
MIRDPVSGAWRDSAISGAQLGIPLRPLLSSQVDHRFGVQSVACLSSHSIRGLCTWTNILKNFRALGKLSCLEFGDLFKVPPEVRVQCFQRLDRDHSDLRLQENWGEPRQTKLCRRTTATLRIPFHRIHPPKESKNSAWRIAAC